MFEEDITIGIAVLLASAPVMPELILRDAIEVAKRIQHRRQRYRVLRALAERLSPAEREEMFGELEIRFEDEALQAESGGDELDDVLSTLPSVRDLLTQFSEPERALLLSDFLDSLRHRLETAGGGKKAGKGPPPPIDEERESRSGTKTDTRETRGIGGGEPSSHPRGQRGNGGGSREWKRAKPPTERTERKVVAESKRIVSTGFASEDKPYKPVAKNRTLAAGQDYFFWLEVGEAVKGSIEEEETVLHTELLPEKARLTVALFNFDGGFKLTPGEDLGELEVQADGSVRVLKQPFDASELSLLRRSYLKESRLLFRVRTSSEEGTYRLRCSIYYKQVLVQSRLITARVMSSSQKVEKALSAKADYNLSRSLSPAHLTQLKPHSLSIMLNSNGDGSHGFSFMGAGDFQKDSVSIPGQKLQDLITQARDAYALVAWGAKNPWDRQNYRYDQPREKNIVQIRSDFIRLAVRGYNIYAALINDLAGGRANVKALKELMSKPGLLQIALKESPSFVLPAALIYDYPFDVDADATKYTICKGFTDALESAAPLEQADCFNGNCPTKGTDTAICPSGFWGYRHNLGLPLSVANAPDAPTEITWQTKPVLTVASSTDPQFTLRKKHLDAVQKLRADIEWNYGETRDDVLRELKETKPHLVYFYCHGGVSETRPYLQVGPADKSGNISPSNLLAKDIFWDTTRPLVFINGCHTTALEPEKAIEFISAFIETADAAGVVGTEITIFEPLATAFAEDCLRRFLDGTPLGEAVRAARLKLLKDGNPLGLVYIPYAMANLRLVQQNK